MAVVLDAFASYITDLLKQVVEDEVGMLLGIAGDIDSMGVKLEDLKNFLADADKRRITNRSVQGWVTELKRAISNMRSSCLAASRETSEELDRSGMVGENILEDTRALVETMLTETYGETGHADNIPTIFAIVGVGGIGKTTLPQKVFNDEAIQREFDKKIWLSVNQDFNESEPLRRAITEAGGDHREAGNAKTTLQRTLKDALNRHKTLLVMDDVWNPGAWESVLKAPFVNVAAPGSRVLVTTRDERVARGMKALLPYHHIDKLVDEDAWSLLKRQVRIKFI
ncbi:unnamed protein product [Alopecurus aequalis]